jgi:hypothetical protein
VEPEDAKADTPKVDTVDAIASDPRWTDRDGWARLAPRYEHGLDEIGSLTNKKREQTAQDDSSIVKKTSGEHESATIAGAGATLNALEEYHLKSDSILS